MLENNMREISILTFEHKEEAETMFPSVKKMVAKHTKVAADKLKKNISNFVKTIDDIVETLPKCRGIYEVDTLTFALSLDGSGKISLIGEISAGFTAGITITFKKRGNT